MKELAETSTNCFPFCAQVTGANKGIGFGIVRKLCKEFKGDVILTGLLIAKLNSYFISPVSSTYCLQYVSVNKQVVMISFENRY